MFTHAGKNKRLVIAAAIAALTGALVFAAVFASCEGLIDDTAGADNTGPGQENTDPNNTGTDPGTEDPNTGVEKAVLEGIVVISGTPKVNQVLTADVSGLTNEKGEPSFQWRGAGQNIAGATGQTFKLPADVFDKKISVVVILL
jgi:hypothetical protein